MSEAVCLDGVRMELDVDRIDVDFEIPGLRHADLEELGWERCAGGEALEPVARFQDGTVIYFHSAPEGEPPSRGYSVESRQPHQWAIELGEDLEQGQRLKVARLHVTLL